MWNVTSHIAPTGTAPRNRRPWEFDWGGTAAFARIYLELWHIHEGDAKPSDALLEGLATATGVPWSFLYYHL